MGVREHGLWIIKCQLHHLYLRPKKKTPLEGCVPICEMEMKMAFLLLFPPSPRLPLKNKAGRILPTSMA